MAIVVRFLFHSLTLIIVQVRRFALMWTGMVFVRGNGVQQVLLYPNPVSGDLFIKFDHTPEVIKVRVYSMLGVLAADYSFTDVNMARISIPLLGVTSGQLLFVRIEADGIDMGMRKVMVAK